MYRPRRAHLHIIQSRADPPDPGMMGGRARRVPAAAAPRRPQCRPARSQRICGASRPTHTMLNGFKYTASIGCAPIISAIRGTMVWGRGSYSGAARGARRGEQAAGTEAARCGEDRRRRGRLRAGRDGPGGRAARGERTRGAVDGRRRDAGDGCGDWRVTKLEQGIGGDVWRLCRTTEE